jgi:hypothetical protein
VNSHARSTLPPGRAPQDRLKKGGPFAARSKGPGTNTGHGHVWRRPDKNTNRCGGIRMCTRCQQDQARWRRVELWIDTHHPEEPPMVIG